MGSGCVVAHGLCAIHSDHFGSHIGEHHRRKRTGSDAGNLDDPYTTERTRHSTTSSA
jgi:hypothetical protein